MSARPANFIQWLQSLPIPWLVSNTVGADDAAAQGTVYDGQVALVKEAVQARFPDDAPSDALPYIGADRQIIRGFSESEDDYRARLKNAWAQWELAGCWSEVLFQLFWSAGLSTSSMWIVQQNGYAYNLTADPAATTDPTTLLNVTALGDNPALLYPTPVPWWTFDDRVDLCARFALIISGVLPGTFLITARAVFNGTDRATATWSGPFDGVDYQVVQGAPQTTDGTAPVITWNNPQRGTIDVQATASFTGYVDFIGYASGASPFNSPSDSTLNTIRKVVKTWKPAKAKFMGIWVVVDGAVWGWPLGTKWGASGLKWGSGTSAHYDP